MARAPEEETMTRLTLAGLVVLAAIGCGDGGGEDPQPDSNNGNNGNNGTPSGDVEYLSPTDHLTRASIALRGQRPTDGELETVRDDPGTLEAIVRGYVDEPAFGVTVREMHNDTLLLRSYAHRFPSVGTLDDEDVLTVNDPVQESALMLIEHVVMNDRPYSEIVTADYMLADGVVAEVWGLDYDGDGTEWIETRWDHPDDPAGPWDNPGRPHAGILSDSYFFVRHDTTVSNLNRARANAVSSGLLCFDFLDRDILVDGSVDLSDPEAVNNAVRENPSCAACHQALDPLGQFFWIYDIRRPTNQIVGYPRAGDDDRVRFYHPERVRLAKMAFPDLRPGYFGQREPDGEFWSVEDLGRMMAEDPRFSLCAAQRFYAYLAQVPLKEVPLSVASPLQADFIAADMSAKELAVQVVLSDAFRASHAATDSAAEGLVGYKKVRPAQMASMVKASTGYEWLADVDIEIRSLDAPSYGRTNLYLDPLLGYGVLAGDQDGYQVLTPLHTFNATSLLTQRSFALEAAGFVVEEELGNSAANRRLLTEIDADTDDEGEVRAQIAVLHLRLHSKFVATDSERVDETYALWRSIEALGDSNRAWKVVVAAMLQDPNFVFY
jgi:hypothetical protein